MTRNKPSRQQTKLSMRRFKFILIFVCVLGMSVGGIAGVHAETITPTPNNSDTTTVTPSANCGNADNCLKNPLNGVNSLTDLIKAILTFIVNDIAPVIITLMLVYCGFLFVLAQGNEEKLRTARTMLLWTVIGAILLLGAVAIENVISTTVGSL